MEILEVHSKDFLIKWVHAPDDCIIDWQVKPLKKSINFSLYEKSAPHGSATLSTDNSLRKGGENPASSADISRDASDCLLLNLNGSIRTATNMNSNGNLEPLPHPSSSSSTSAVNLRRTGSYKPKSRSNTFSSGLSKSDLVLVKDYKKLIAEELVHGKYEVKKGGMYAFIFDNSFSKTTLKKVLFSSKILLPNKKSRRIYRRALINQTKSYDKKSANSTSSGKSFISPSRRNALECILLKKRRKKLQGFVKRYFILDFTYGVLSYFRVNDDKLRGQMPIRLAIITANSKSREIIIDSGMEVWELKPSNKKDFNVWVEAFNKVKVSRYSLESTIKDVIEDIDGNLVLRELENVSKKLNSLKFKTKSSPEVLLLNILLISDEVEVVLDKLKVISKSLQTADSHSLLSSGDFYDAKEYIDAFGSGVNIIGKPDEARTNADSDESEVEEGFEGVTPTISSASSSSDSNEEASSSLISAPEDKLSLRSEVSEGKGENDDDLYPLPFHAIERAYDIPVSKNSPPSLISILRKNVGKDMSTISMPVDLNEPLSTLQKFAEMFEYTDLIDNALQADSGDLTGERILRIAAFAVSYLSSMRVRERNTRKPFNPLLGETFELVREDLGYRLISEKVSHRPLVCAIYVESANWTFSFSPKPSQKFWGKNFEIITEGSCRLMIRSTGEIFTWTQPTTQLKNIIAGEKYSEPSGSITVRSSRGFKAVVEFASAGMFGGRSEDLSIIAYGPDKEALPYTINGKWTESLTLNTSSTEKLIWTVRDILPNANKKFGFTKFAGTLNKITEIERNAIAPTDSRLRPDIKFYEKGDIQRAEEIKNKLEEKQRERRKQLEENNEVYRPTFFEYSGDDRLGMQEWVYKKGEDSYWNRRKKNNWDDLLKLWN